MRKLGLIGLLGVSFVLLLFPQAGWTSQEFVISCEGTESTGGGTYRYQYTLKNISGAPVTLTDFFVGTEDPNPSNYSFIVTSGFTASIVPNPSGGASVAYTSMVKTPHGVVPPAVGQPSAKLIHWSGNGAVPAGGTVTFAFDHPGESVDEEWFAKASGQWTISQVDRPMAGPTGTYTDGWVHAPLPPHTPAVSSWGVLVLAMLALVIAVWALARRRKPARGTA
jgi:hypothetical protein